jgi:ribonuclease HII
MNKAEQLLEAGVDEAGRGPLAGPVVVAAVILPSDHDLTSLDDSKRLSARKREQLAPLIQTRAIAWRVEFVDIEEIDRVNILQATMNGMQRAVNNLRPAPARALIDGNRAPELTCAVQFQRHRYWPRFHATSICRCSTGNTRIMVSTAIRGIPPPFTLHS